MNNFEHDNYDNEDLNSSNVSTSQEEYDTNDYEESGVEFNNQWRRKHNGPINVFAMFARSLGVFSLFCAFFSIFFGAFICGGMAIILAFLSKGYNTKLERNAKIGIIAGVAGIIFQISTLTVSVYNIINVPEYREQFNSLYEQMYGVPVDESITDFLDQLGVSDLEGGIL